jgi:hypothetical protein
VSYGKKEGEHMKIGEKGNLFLIMIFIVLVLVTIPAFIIGRNPNLKILVAILLFFAVWSYVRNVLGEGILSWIIGAILIYLLWKYFLFATVGVTIWLLVATGGMSALLWGLGNNLPRLFYRH